jgi:uncharacterized membrane protein YraQ (UPF0718 family)
MPDRRRRAYVSPANALIGVSPFLALSIGVAAYAGASGADNLIAKAFSGHVLSMIVMAAVIGAFSPFCSCGVIPLIAALLTMGVPLAPVMAFWLASPLMDPSMFILTAGTLGDHLCRLQDGSRRRRRAARRLRDLVPHARWRFCPAPA